MRQSESRRLKIEIAFLVAAALLFGWLFVSSVMDDDGRAVAIGSGIFVFFLSAIAYSDFCKLRELKPARETVVDFPSQSGADGMEMMAVLESLGIPIDGGVSSPQSAMIGGFAKATIYRAHQQIMSGRLDEGVQALETILGSLQRENDPAWNRIGAAAHYLIAKVHQAKGERESAMAELNESLRLAPDYLLAQAGLRSYRPTEH